MDHLSILEAAYTADLAANDWEVRLIEALSTIDEGLGVMVGTVRRRSLGDASCPRQFIGNTCSGIMRSFEEMLPKMPRRDVDICFSLANSGQTGSSICDPNGFDVYDLLFSQHGARDCLGIYGLVDWRTTFGVYVPLREKRVERAGVARRLQRLGVHLGAALRARQGRHDEGLFEPDGRVAHLEGDAVEERDLLREHVRAIDRVRATAGRSDVDQALDVWTALCDGRWSLLDRFESDGRRYVVARRNPPALGAALSLTAREEQVVKLHAMGQSSKLVGYTLGLAASTVSTHLSVGMRKLGLASRAELVLLWDSLHENAEES